MAKLKRKRAGISSGNITEVMDAAQAAAESGADQKYIENPYNKKLDEDIKKVATAQRDAQRKVEAADYADMVRDNPVKNLDVETQAYVKKHKDATLEPKPEPEKPKGQPKPKPEPEVSDPTKAVLVVPQPSKSGGSGSGGTGGGGSGGSGSGSGAGGSGPSDSGKSRTERMKDFFSRKNKTVYPPIDGTQPTVLDKKSSILPEFLRDIGLTDLQADALARMGGYYTSIKILKQRYLELQYEAEKLEKEANVFNADKLKIQSEYKELLKELNDLQGRYNYIIKKGMTTDEETKEAKTLSDQIIDLESELKTMGMAEKRFGSTRELSLKYQRFIIKKDDLEEEFNKYYTAVSIGREKKNKEEGWQAQAANFSLNAQNLLGKPVINDISQQVGYGGMTGRSAVEGLNAITGGYKIRDEANSWTRTNVGDRQLVEALVNVRPNRVITPFGVPGTVGESNLSQQFQYSSPLRRIGVGDVTARGGYQINIEDIHRKRRNSQPAIVRKKLMQKKLAKQKKLAEQQKLAEQRKLAEKKMFVTSKNVIKTSMIIKNPGVAKAISFVGKIQSPMVGGVKDIKGLNNEISVKGSAPLGKSSNLTVGNNTINMKSIKSFASMAVITNMKKKKVTK